MIKNLAIITVLFILQFATSCGFTVLYDQKTTGLNYEKELAAIKIQKDAGTTSQELRTAIYNAINPDHFNEEIKYYLVLNSSESISSTFLTSAGSSGRNKLNMTVKYELKSYKNDRLVTSGIVKDSESYNVNLNRYGTYTAEEFARSNLAKALSQKIRNLLVQDIIELR